jgi:hypothetical protein
MELGGIVTDKGKQKYSERCLSQYYFPNKNSTLTCLGLNTAPGYSAKTCFLKSNELELNGPRYEAWYLHPYHAEIKDRFFTPANGLMAGRSISPSNAEIHLNDI